jgi:hypothetical protein
MEVQLNTFLTFIIKWCSVNVFMPCPISAEGKKPRLCTHSEEGYLVPTVGL